MPSNIDYYFFTQSPFAYLGHARLVEIARRSGASIRLRPMDAAKVFPVSSGLPVAQRPAQRKAYRLTELTRWSRFLGVPIHLQPRHFPVATEPSARLIIAADETDPAAAVALTGRVLAAVWAEERDIAAESTLIDIAQAAGFDGARLFERSRAPEIAARYETYTQEAIDLQVFGAPTYVYRGELFWGQDRLDFLERALVDTAT